jgi:hypothetical protein
MKRIKISIAMTHKLHLLELPDDNSEDDLSNRGCGRRYRHRLSVS